MLEEKKQIPKSKFQLLKIRFQKYKYSRLIALSLSIYSA